MHIIHLPQTTSLKASNANAIEMKSAKISSVDLKYMHTRQLQIRLQRSCFTYCSLWRSTECHSSFTIYCIFKLLYLYF